MTGYPPFYSDCVGWPKDRSHALDLLIEEADEIPLDRFRDMIGNEAFEDLARGLGYAFGDEEGLRIEQDYHVRCEMHAGSGVPFLVHSAIEHVFAKPETIDALQERAMQDLQQEKAAKDALVLVHPGSMCGSARMELGKLEADGARAEVMEALRAHDGPIVVIDGGLSDELSAGEEMIIQTALDEAASNGHTALRIWGCDAGDPPFPGWEGRSPGSFPRVTGHQNEAAVAVAPFLEGCRITVTGAWVEREESGVGCVNGVTKVLRETLGENADVDICDTAIRAPDPDPEDDAPEMF